jgi:hypothetical protein
MGAERIGHAATIRANSAARAAASGTAPEFAVPSAKDCESPVFSEGVPVLSALGGHQDNPDLAGNVINPYTTEDSGDTGENKRDRAGTSSTALSTLTVPHQPSSMPSSRRALVEMHDQRRMCDNSAGNTESNCRIGQHKSCARGRSIACCDEMARPLLFSVPFHDRLPSSGWIWPQSAVEIPLCCRLSAFAGFLFYNAPTLVE